MIDSVASVSSLVTGCVYAAKWESHGESFSTGAELPFCSIFPPWLSFGPFQLAPTQKSEMALEVAPSQEQAPEGTKPPDTVLQLPQLLLVC